MSSKYNKVYLAQLVIFLVLIKLLIIVAGDEIYLQFAGPTPAAEAYLDWQPQINGPQSGPSASVNQPLPQ